MTIGLLPDVLKLQQARFQTVNKRLNFTNCQREPRFFSLAFTLCQVPIVFTPSSREEIILSFNNGGQKTIRGNTIPEELSRMIFARSGEIERIEVSITK